MIKVKPTPPQEILKEYFDYHKDGKLVWKKSTGRTAKIGNEAGYLNDNGYIQIRFQKKLYGAHRLIWVWHCGDIPMDKQIDHMDKNRSNNKIENLQLATNAQNSTNRSLNKRNKSGFNGVYFDKQKGKFVTCLTRLGKRKYLGCYDTAKEANEACVAYDSTHPKVFEPKMNISPKFISELQNNEIFVYGANEIFLHGAGAARLAQEKFGAKNGIGPFCGQSYGICTKDKEIQTLPISAIKTHVDNFIAYAANKFQYNFLVTPIGTGLAGYKASDIAPLFAKARYNKNIFLPKEFVDLI